MITDTVTITELSRLTNKSRPTMYKWLTLYENGKKDDLPQTIRELFELIEKTGSKKSVYQFCEEKFINSKDDEVLKEIIDLLRANVEKLNLTEIKNYILEELKNE